MPLGLVRKSFWIGTNQNATSLKSWLASSETVTERQKGTCWTCKNSWISMSEVRMNKSWTDILSVQFYPW